MCDSARGGSDTLTVTNSGDSSQADLFGDAHTMDGSVQGGNDTLTVTNAGLGSHADLYGDAVELENNPQGGNDLLTATDSGLGSSATLFGDASIFNNFSAHGGNDTLIGGVGNDTLYGDAKTYVAPGSFTGGTDILNGGAGNDQLWGGPNDDTFVFNVGSGNDTINQFNRGNSAVGSTATEHDVIDVHAYGFSWSDLQTKFSEVSGNAVIQLSANDSINLVGVDFNDLHQTDFII